MFVLHITLNNPTNNDNFVVAGSAVRVMVQKRSPSFTRAPQSCSASSIPTKLSWTSQNISHHGCRLQVDSKHMQPSKAQHVKANLTRLDIPDDQNFTNCSTNHSHSTEDQKQFFPAAEDVRSRESRRNTALYSSGFSSEFFVAEEVCHEKRKQNCSQESLCQFPANLLTLTTNSIFHPTRNKTIRPQFYFTSNHFKTRIKSSMSIPKLQSKHKTPWESIKNTSVHERTLVISKPSFTSACFRWRTNNILVLLLSLVLLVGGGFAENSNNALSNHRSGGGAGSASPCPVSEHTCDNLQCVPRDKVCNGHDDCGDLSDERPGCTRE